MSSLTEWIGSACADLGIDQGIVDQRGILDLAREVAHKVDRPAAPITAFLLGALAVGGGQDLRAAADRLLDLAGRWPDSPDAD